MLFWRESFWAIVYYNNWTQSGFTLSYSVNSTERSQALISFSEKLKLVGTTIGSKKIRTSLIILDSLINSLYILDQDDLGVKVLLSKL